MKKIIIVLLFLFSVFSIVGCKKTELEIKGPNEVEVGCSILLSTNLENNSNVVWETSDPNIATVFNGTVIGVQEGNVVISAKLNDLEATYSIKVLSTTLTISITGPNVVYINEMVLFEANLSKEINSEISWSVSDEQIAFIDNDGYLTGLLEGKIDVIVTVLGVEERFSVTVMEEPEYYDPNIYSISVQYTEKIELGQNYNLKPSIKPHIPNITYVFESSDSNIIQINENGNYKGLNVGLTEIKVYILGNEQIYSTIIIEVIKTSPDSIKITGDNTMIQGKYNNLSVNITGGENKEIIWESSDNTTAIVSFGIVLAFKPGTVTIKAISKVNDEVFDTFEINISPMESEEPSKEDLNKVNRILNNMTLSQKIGQMFVVGFSGTTLPSSLTNAIEQYNFGNVIYMAYNVSNYKTLSTLSNDIQEKMMNYNNVPAFISIDQEGGRVARLTNGGTHFISNMAMCATGDPNNTYLEGIAMGKELRNYGINVNFAPVLDVNNNPDNPVIGARSYAEDPFKVSQYGNNMFLGLQESGVMGSAKHFPGHGNTSVDSHYGLPTITSTIDELYQTELAPFISAISHGIDSIMTTHIIFTAIDPNYPATLSKKVVTDLVRNELKYDGLIITDGMEMGALTSNFGTNPENAISAINAGVDVLLYTSLNTPIQCHSAIMSAVQTNQISIERIDDSVRRILLKKLKYGLLEDDNYLAKNEDITNLLVENETLNNNFAMQSLTLMKGEFNGLDKNKSTLIISPTTSYSLGNGLTSNSLANYACNYLQSNGHSNCDYLVVSENISASDINNIVSEASKYEQVVIGLSNVKTKGYTNNANLVNKLYSNNNDLVVIALDTPYDYLLYNSNIENYICVYGYQKASTIAISKYLNGEFEARGVSPIYFK